MLASFLTLLAALNMRAEVYSGTCGENLTWQLNTETGKLSITGSGAMNDYKYYDDHAPWFEYRRQITSVSMSNGLTNIGVYAFLNCSSLTAITIPSSVTDIKYGAFYGCSSLTSMTIPEGVTSIGGHVFEGCTGLTSVSFPSTITSIGAVLFTGCSNLTSLSVASGNTTFDSRNNSNAIIETATNTLVVGCNTTVIPSSVTSIGDYAFDGLSNLTSITIPESVTSIGRSAFYNCTGLTSVNIPSGVTCINEYVFRGCSSLTFITIPSSVTDINYAAFSGSGLTSITLPKSITCISTYSFMNCDNLTSITIPSNVTLIQEAAFKWCSGLTSVTIPESVTEIEGEAFAECSSLTSIRIPKNVTTIGGSAFNNCSSLTSVTVCNPTPVTITANTFSNRANATLHVPQGSKTAYETTNYWWDFREIVEDMPGGQCGDNLFWSFNTSTNVLTITGTGAMYSRTSSSPLWADYKTSITSVNLPDGLTTIGASAFNGCSSLTSIHIPEGVTSLGDFALQYCSALTSLAIPASLTSIGRDALIGCSAATSMTVAAGNTAYDSRNGCNAIIRTSDNTLIAGCNTTVIPPSVTSIGNSAFKNCTGLTSITIPAGVTGIGSLAFEGCTNLTTVTALNPTPATLLSSYTGPFPTPANLTLYVPQGSKSAYEAATYWKDFGTIEEMAPGSIDLVDGEEYVGFGGEVTMETITYSRTFKNTNWQPWYVPFDMTLTSELLSDFAFARFAGTYTDEDGTFYLTILRLNEGELVKANTAYFVQAKTADSNNAKTFTVEDATLYPAESNSFYMLSADKKITVTGIYTPKVVTAEDQGWYAYSGGRYSQQTKLGNTLNPNRFFVTIEDREDNPYATRRNPTEVKIKVLGEDDATDVKDVKDLNDLNNAIYDLQGRRVENPTKGIYVVNGRKVLFK